MHVTYNSFNLALSLVILVVSSDEEFVTTETVEEFAAIEAFEHSGEELAFTLNAFQTWWNKFFLSRTNLLSKQSIIFLLKIFITHF